MGGLCGPLEPQRAATFLLDLVYFPNLLGKKKKHDLRCVKIVSCGRQGP